MEKSSLPFMILLSFLGNCITSVMATPSQAARSSSFFSSNSMQGRIGLGIAVEYSSVTANLKIDPDLALGNISASQSHVARKIQFAPSLELGVFINDDYYLGFVASWRHSGGKKRHKIPH